MGEMRMVGSRHGEGVASTSALVELPSQRSDPVEVHRGSLFLRSLPLHDLRRILPYLRVREVGREEALHHEGAMIRSIVFPHDVTVSLIIFLRDGTLMETATVGTEGFV